MYKYFTDCETLEDVKKQYKKLAIQFHPDINKNADSTKIMQEINSEYELAFNQYKNIFRNADNQKYTKENDETSDIYKDIINKIIHFDGVKIEIIGSWVWLTGNTYSYKNELKEIDFSWSNTKKAWYYHAEGYKKHNNKKYSLNDIRNMWGSKEIENKPQPCIA